MIANSGLKKEDLRFKCDVVINETYAPPTVDVEFGK